MTDDVERLLDQVTRFQRQARRVAFAQALGVAAGTAFAAVAVQTQMVRTEPATSRWLVLGIAAISALLMAALVAWLRTPSMQQTASAIDRGLRLEDRVVAALQLHRTHDVVAGLVVSDAVRKLQGTSPEHVFPMRVGWWASPAVVGAGLVVVAMAVDPASPPTTSLTSGSGGSGSAARVARPGQGEASGSRSGDTRRPNAEPHPAVAPDGALAGKPAPAAPVAPRRTPSHPVSPAVAPDGALAGKPAASAGPGAPVRDADGAAASTTSADGARGAGADGPRAPRGGGVGGAPTAERTIEPLGQSLRSAMSAPALAAARAQAEAAIGRGEIPPAFRKVRA